MNTTVNPANIWSVKYIHDEKPTTRGLRFFRRNKFAAETWHHMPLKRMYNTASLTVERIWRMGCFTLRWTSAAVFLTIGIVVVVRVISFFGFSADTAAKSFWSFLKHLVWGN